MKNNETTTDNLNLVPSTSIQHHHLYIHSDGICTVNGQTFQVKKGDTIQINYQPNEN